MRAYSLVFDTPDGTVVHFVGSEAEARQFRMSLMKTEGLKRKEVEINMVEIPTGKADLLKWINAEFKR